MTPEESVSGWIGGVRKGDDDAVARLWQRYFHLLVGLARAHLRGAPCRAADEEDVALSVFDSFCRGAEAGRFPDLNDRDGLWRLLVVLTARKAAHLRRDEMRQKRGGGAVLDQAGVSRAGAAGPGLDDLEWVAANEPTPAFAVQVAEQCERLLARLDGVGLRELAVHKMEGHTNAEIALRLGCSVSTVERRLQIVRWLWSEERDEAAE
jgi:DNA-directed RNA polymerase specialized sigma24 family protein